MKPIDMKHRERCLYLMTLLTISSIAIDYSSVECSKASCSICGQRCLDACGTEAFRPCCLSYNRKRAFFGNQSDPGMVLANGVDEATSNNLNRQATIDLLSQLYASLDGVISAQPNSGLTNVRKKPTSKGQWKYRPLASPESTDSLD